MKNNLLKSISALALLLAVHTAQAQTQKANLTTVLTADSLNSGTWKDVLTSFFQLSFDKFTGPRKELNFQSNPFALLLKSHPEAAVDTNYYKYKVLRKFNFGFGLHLDTAYRFNGFTSGVRYALVNKRDTATSKALFRSLGTDSLNLQIDSLQIVLEAYIDSVFKNDNAQRRTWFGFSNTLFTDKTVSFGKLDTAFQSAVKNLAGAHHLSLLLNLLVKKPGVNLARESQIHFADLKKELQNALLWTVSLTDTTYKDQFFFSNILLKTDLLKGIGKYKPGANWQLNLQAGVNFVDDTLKKGRNLNRSLLRFEPGFTLVFRNKANDQSFFEAGFSGSYRRNFGSLYRSERRDSVTVNAALRVRIIGDIWVPLEIKYDPRSGNVFGFLNVRLNFKSLGKLTGDSAKS